MRSDLRGPFLVSNPGSILESAEDLDEAASSDAFLAWLVTRGEQVDMFERMSTPLEDIFVSVAQGVAV